MDTIGSLLQGEPKHVDVDVYDGMHHYDQPGDGNAAQASLLIEEIRPNDVLLGRGTHANINEGNVRFRQLVSERGAEYRSATKRMRKDMIARAVVNEIGERGGRFLQLVPIDSLGGENEGRSLWKEADHEVIVVKAKQALRGRGGETKKAAALKKGTGSGAQGADK